MSAKQVDKTKQILITLFSVLLFVLAGILPLLQYGFGYFGAYLLYCLPGVFGLLYLKGREKKYRWGVYVSAVLAVVLGYLISGGILNTYNLLLYVLLAVLVS